MHRFVEKEAQRQKNIEDIAAKALPLLEAGADPDAMEDDWVTNFFDKSRIVSDGEMQTLWSRVLAGEANAPGTYSKRTVNFLSDLDKMDAALFTKLCGFSWMIGNVVPLVFDTQADIYIRNGTTFDSLIHLESIGLIQFNNIGGFVLQKLPKGISVHYYGKPLALQMAKDVDNVLDIGHALMTKIGRELAPICGSRPVDGFWEYVQERWKQHLPENQAEQDAASNAGSAGAPPASAS